MRGSWMTTGTARLRGSRYSLLKRGTSDGGTVIRRVVSARSRARTSPGAGSIGMRTRPPSRHSTTKPWMGLPIPAMGGLSETRPSRSATSSRLRAGATTRESSCAIRRLTPALSPSDTSTG